MALTRRDLLVIPVLVGDAAMPRREHLPRDLAALAECNALRVTDEGYEHEVERLIRTLDHVVNSTTYGAHASAARRPPPSGTAAPRPRISRSDSAAFTSAASVAADQARVEIGEVERGGRGSRRRSHSGLIDRDRLRRNELRSASAGDRQRLGGTGHGQRLCGGRPYRRLIANGRTTGNDRDRERKGYGKDEMITIRFHDVDLNTVRANATGTFTTQITVPADWPFRDDTFNVSAMSKHTSRDGSAPFHVR